MDENYCVIYESFDRIKPLTYTWICILSVATQFKLQLHFKMSALTGSFIAEYNCVQT